MAELTQVQVDFINRKVNERAKELSHEERRQEECRELKRRYDEDCLLRINKKQQAVISVEKRIIEEKRKFYLFEKNRRVAIRQLELNKQEKCNIYNCELTAATIQYHAKLAEINARYNELKRVNDKLLSDYYNELITNAIKNKNDE